MSRVGDLGGRLYRGEVSFNFVGRQRLWYTISGLILLISVVALLTRGLNFSEEFKGGSSFQFPANSSTSQGAIAQVVNSAGGGQATVQHLTGRTSQWVVQTASLVPDVTTQVASAISSAFHIPVNQISISFVGATWGGQISTKAIEALIIFLIVIVIYLTIAFEWKMAIAAFVALLHNIVITTGVYALVGFPVAPATVIGLLTILGYSLYDTVVVFDKVRENTAGLLTTGRSTYSEAANLALNQTLVRSINTSLTALLPVASILFIGGALLGTGTLNDLSLVLFVGMLSGTYSSIFIATPVLADLKEREPQYKELAIRVKRRAAGGRAAQRTAATVTTPGGAATAVTTATATPVRTTPAPPTSTWPTRPGSRTRRRTPAATRSPSPPPSRRARRRGAARTAPGRSAGSSPAAAAARSAAPARGRRGGNPAVTEASQEAEAQAAGVARLIAAHIRDVRDYPQPGVMFKDITPLLAEPKAFTAVVDALAATFGPVDKVAGIEARGFILAAPVAYEIGAGFVPVRKQGKLPSATFAQEYELEYGSATLEVHQDAFEPGDRVLIVDDVLATGGTARATATLVERSGAEVAGIVVLMELSFLNGRSALSGLDVRALLAV